MISDEDHDQDSLFGSPPPSPQLRAQRQSGSQLVSPTLALPGVGETNRGNSGHDAATQKNVGTIALPGSQLNSELPIVPLALLLNLGIVQRPPAINSNITTSTTSAGNHVPQKASMSTSRQPGRASTSTPPPLIAPKKPKPKKRKKPSATEEQRPQPLELKFPDPSAPPPTHFLRNQQNLLGRAGLIARVKPSTLNHASQPNMLSKSQGRGTSSNPIVLDIDKDDSSDDDITSPTIGRSSSTFMSMRGKSRGGGEAEDSTIDAALPAPTTQEIVAVLIKQKDIIPILRGVMKHIEAISGKGEAPGPPSTPISGFTRQSSSNRGSGTQSQPPSQSQPSQNVQPTQFVQPPPKKRKLNRVPAGALDWDVPYPFAEGEGPDAYKKNWEKERGKRLMTQLMKLIKVATKTAAVKKYLAMHGQLPNTGRHRRSKSKQKNLEANASTSQISSQAGDQIHDVLQDTSNSTTRTSTPISGSTTTMPPGAIHLQSSNPPLNQQQEFLDFFSLFNSNNSAIMPGIMPQFHNASGVPNNIFSISGSDEGQNSSLTPEPSIQDLMSVFSTQPSFNLNSVDGGAMETFVNSHGSTPAPDGNNFGFGFGYDDASSNMNYDALSSMFGLDSGMAGGDMNNFGSAGAAAEDGDFASVLASLFNQPELQGQQQQVGNSNSYTNLISATSTSASTPSPDSVATGRASTTPIDDSMIDPDLLMQSYNFPAVDSYTTSSLNPPMSLARLASPVTTASSSGGNGPATPASAEWDMTFPEMLNGAEFVGSGNPEDLGLGIENGMTLSLSLVPELMKELTTLPLPEVEATSKPLDKGKGRAVEPEDTMPLQMSTFLQATESQIPESVSVQSGDTVSSTSQPSFAFSQIQAKETPESILVPDQLRSHGTVVNVCSSLTATPSPAPPALHTEKVIGDPVTETRISTVAQTTRKRRKEEVLKKAKEKREQLKKELDEIKMKLWRTTIEQAGLLQLLRSVEQEKVVRSENTVDVSST